MRSSPRSASLESNKRRHLISPSRHNPWSADVNGVIPKAVADQPRPAIAGAIHGKWACCGYSNGTFYVWQIKTSNLTEPLDPPREYAKIYLPDFHQQVTTTTATTTTTDNETEQEEIIKPLVALSSSQGDNDSINLYVLHPITGRLTLSKISRKDLQANPMPRSQQYSASIRIGDPTISDDHILEDDETFQSLTCKKSLTVIGTSRRQLFLITHIAVPFGLQVQLVKPTAGTGFLSRLFGGVVGGGGGGMTTSSSNSDGGKASSESVSVQILPLSQTEFLAVSIEDGICHWTVEQKIATAHHATFTANHILNSLTDVLASQDSKVKEVVKAAMSVDKKSFHAIVRGETNDEGEDRLFWTVLDTATGKVITSRWLDRFPLPNQIPVLGLTTCDNNNAYAAFSSNGSVIVMVLLGEDDGVIQEVDLPSVPVPGLYPSMFERDQNTYGCFLVASSGISVRVRYMAQESLLHTSKRPRLGESQTGDAARTLNRATLQTLVSHLRAHFWQTYQNPHTTFSLPPSLRQSTIEREQAIIDVAIELQHKGDPSSHGIAIQWHGIFVKLIQDGGLYRSLHKDSKFKMFHIGQELEVFGQVSHVLLNRYPGLDWNEMQSHDLGEWFLGIQKQEEESGWPNAEIWEDVLRISFEAFFSFKDEFLEARYDVVVPDKGPLSWISDPSMQEMLHRQLRHWKNSREGVSLSVIELVVKVALLSYSESWRNSNNDDDVRKKFAKIQKLAISLLRSANAGDDELAFDLCIDYEYFEGLCEISVAHERLADSKLYALDPLFDKLRGRDLVNNLTFPVFVLQWHTDRRLFGHTINYGQYSIHDLTAIMDRNDELRKYRWISSLRQGHYDKTTDYALESCKENESLENTLWSLSLAKLTSKLGAAQNPVRQRQIEKQIDLVNAQKMLHGDGEGDEYELVWSQEALIFSAIEKLTNVYDRDEKLRLATIGLAVCASLDDEKMILEYTSKIWSEILMTDMARWTDWASGLGPELPLIREEAEDTAFCILLEECRKDKNLSRVTYGRHFEAAVLDRILAADHSREGFTRVLRAVAAPAESIQGESLMVSSF